MLILVLMLALGLAVLASFLRGPLDRTRLCDGSLRNGLRVRLGSRRLRNVRGTWLAILDVALRRLLRWLRLCNGARLRADRLACAVGRIVVTGLDRRFAGCAFLYARHRLRLLLRLRRLRIAISRGLVALIARIVVAALRLRHSIVARRA